MISIDRRAFLTAAAALAAAPLAAAQGDPAPDWGGPVLDTHLHLRAAPDANYAHIAGCGVTHAVLLARDTAAPQVRAASVSHPGLFAWTAGTDITSAGAAAALRRAVADGAVGLGEIKAHVAADGPELRVSQANNPRAARLAGKCVARETLTVLKSASTPEMFRKLTWTNARHLFRLGV